LIVGDCSVTNITGLLCISNTNPDKLEFLQGFSFLKQPTLFWDQNISKQSKVSY